MNVTTVNATANSFLTVFPTDKPRPLAANLIWDAGQHPANAVTVAVSGDGRISFYNLGGTVDIVVDVVGFYEPSTAGTGPAGPAGPAGGRGFSAWDTIPSGQTVTGSIVWDGQTAGGTGSDAINVDLPGVAPVALNSLTVNFSFGSGAADADPTCTGTNQLPTAPPGKVCIYKGSVFGLDPATLVGRANDNPIGTLSSRSFQVSWLPIFAVAGTDEFFYGTWAYRAP